jgi:hypothetical protein
MICVCVCVCVNTVLNPQVTVMAVKNSILHKPSLTGYQQLNDKCILSLVCWQKKPLRVHHPNKFIMLFCIPAEGYHFQHLLQLLITVINSVKLSSLNTYAHNSFRSHLQTYIHRKFLHPLSPEHTVYV